MAALQDLIAQIEDPILRDRIAKEADKLTKTKKFGLVFEEHIPECTPLYDIPVKKGCQIILRNRTEDKSIYTVQKIENGQATCFKKEEPDTTVILNIKDIVRVAEFGEPIYPYLELIDSVCNAPDSDLWHTLIEADNYHALQLLEYLYADQVDCIYIDPPYNTGARDWKYNNDYVDSNDLYRHSKWLSMMEKRLKLAKKLLKPDNSVLIVTIDEKEYLHLGCLLEQMFPEARTQMVTSVTNKKGQPRTGIFSRSEEYIFVLFFGNAMICRTSENMLFPENDSTIINKATIWNSLLRRGTHSARADRPKLFYPIIIDEKNSKIVAVENPLDLNQDRSTFIPPKGCTVAWPLHKDGSEGNWQMKPESLRNALDKGTAKLGRKDKKSGAWSILYLKRKQLQQVENGELKCDGKDENGALILRYPDANKGEDTLSLQEPRSIWVKDSHDASVYGSTLLNNILKNHKFAFPKSLYAVTDALRFFVANKPNALIVDFFAGSGTTLHAVNLLNAEDGGHRRCIMVTNNEVSDEEAKVLTMQGYQPGDKEWEQYGIAKYVTWPRTVCSIKGHDVNGESLKGNYLGSDIPMADGFKANAAYFKLGFLDKTSVALGMQFREMIPTLWMKAGAVGPCPVVEANIPDMLILPENRFAVLNNEDAFSAFAEELNKYPEIQTVFLVTDYEVNYRSMVKNLNVETTYQLYRDYLDNFRINHGRD